MSINNKPSLDEILAALRGKDSLLSPEKKSQHLSSEEIFQYLEKRYKLEQDNPLRRKVLNHVVECNQCYRIFRDAHELIVELENDSVPDTSEESKRKIFETFFGEGTTKPPVTRPQQEKELAAAPLSKRLIYKNQAFRCEIYKQSNKLFLSIATDNSESIGRQVRVCIISDDYKVGLIKWRKNGPEEIISEESIDESGSVEIEIAETDLDPQEPSHFRILEDVFKEIKLNIYCKERD
ncbi:hypothetical protein GF312_13455 [Candidatus Poribacteria bacterium]|nr:hypothetical protein [Candidatus Poribacteria bacterium]